MNTPICDFVNKYSQSDSLRLHMPGHKGKEFLGFESGDITEFSGADSLYEAKGIIAESERNASNLFGGNTFYSAEGSSLSIRAMIYLLKLWCNDILILAARNCHKAFVSAVAMTDADVEWLYPAKRDNYLACRIDLNELDARLSANKNRKCAVYITTPDYLGNIADVRSISEICRKHGALLCVDNAHGAYLKFLSESKHPIDLGADICCDSAHKTLPVITGGGYLHIASSAPNILKERAKDALSLFGSTSPSYLVLQSLDYANKYIYEGYGEKLAAFCKKMEKAKEDLRKLGYNITETEPLKMVISAKEYGYTGVEAEEILRKNGIFCEFADKDHLVMMFTPENGCGDLAKLKNVLKAIPKKDIIKTDAPTISPCERVLSIRDALFAESEEVDISESEGRIFAGINISCPPAVPLILAGEKINGNTIENFRYYQIEKCRVAL